MTIEDVRVSGASWAESEREQWALLGAMSEGVEAMQWNGGDNEIRPHLMQYLGAGKRRGGREVEGRGGCAGTQVGRCVGCW